MMTHAWEKQIPCEFGSFACRLQGFFFRKSDQCFFLYQGQNAVTVLEQNAATPMDIIIWDDDAPDGTVKITTLRFEGLPLLGETHKRCALGYCIDEKEQLIGMYQCIIGGDDGYTYFKTDAKSDYSRIRSDLIAKYGQPIGELTNGSGTLLTAHTHVYIDADISDYYGTTSTCSQWLVQYDDCYCIIELFIREGNSVLQTRGMVDSVYLAYRFVTATELDELMQDAQQRKNEQYRDI